MRSQVFTRQLIDVLIEAGEIEDGLPCHLRDRGIEVHGYGIDEEEILNLVTTIYRGEVPPRSVSQTDVATAFRRSLGLWERVKTEPYYERLEESSDSYDMVRHIHQKAPDIRRIRVFLGTDGRAAIKRASTEERDGVEVRQDVWDIERLHRLETSGQPREPIQIDFVERFGTPLPCLPVGSGDRDYDAMLAAIPGDWLADIYREYGARLLELNVRSFLQAAGKVNRGIRDTLRSEPNRFLAYNNGISATASSVRFTTGADGAQAIAGVTDLQIVNGGQTTASVHRAKETGVDLSSVAVQAKLTVISPERLDEIVPLISRFANSQNKVSEADLRANDPFHVELEQLSRTVWAPPIGDALKQTRWFYERARGQYRDALSREGTPARKKAWKVVHPSAQRFTKTDLAKFENTWAQLPHEVSRGAQKNFTMFMANLAQAPVKPGEDYFRRLIAEAILWKRTERLVTELKGDGKFLGYRANVVTYAIAKLSHATAQRVDLNRIWDEQGLTDAVEAALVELAHVAWKVLVDEAPVGANVTEWAKQERCWREARNETWSIPPTLDAELVELGVAGDTPPGSPAGSEDDPSVRECMAVAPDEWFALANWAKETRSLSSWQRKLASDIGVRVSRGRPPSQKQARYGSQILKEAHDLGFQMTDQAVASGSTESK
ncbi:MAG TPA: AIPR family protein [Solirubrobacterales bacterium]|nr:AIPR family protein [Solirubrobacterales bacterium]